MKKSEIKIPYIKTMTFFMLLVPFFFCFYLYGNFYSLFPGIPLRIVFTPVLPDDLMYYTAYWFGIIGMLSVIFIGIRAYTYEKDAQMINCVKKAYIIWILIYILFAFSNPRFLVQVFPQAFGFTNIQATEVKNPSMYYFWIDTLGYDYVGHYPFKTLDESIAGLEYAKRKRDENMYGYIFSDMEKFGYEKILEKYSDEFFQKRLLVSILSVGYGEDYDYQIARGDKFFSQLNILEKLSTLNQDAQIKNVLTNVFERYTEYQKGKIEKKEFFENISKIYNAYTDITDYPVLK